MAARFESELASLIGERVAASARVHGGDINDAYRVELADGRVLFVKTHARPRPDMYPHEARGLD